MTTEAPAKPTGRQTQVVRLSRALYIRLYRERQPGETYDDVLRRLFTVYDLLAERAPGQE